MFLMVDQIYSLPAENKTLQAETPSRPEAENWPDRPYVPAVKRNTLCPTGLLAKQTTIAENMARPQTLQEKLYGDAKNQR